MLVLHFDAFSAACIVAYLTWYIARGTITPITTTSIAISAPVGRSRDAKNKTEEVLKEERLIPLSFVGRQSE